MTDADGLVEAVARKVADQRKIDDVAAGFPPYPSQDEILPMDRRAARAALSAISEAGWRVVPVVPTEAMMAEVNCDGERRTWLSGTAWEQGWKLMLAAAPKVPG